MKEEYKKAMGRALKQLRVKNGLNQFDLAKSLGVSRTFISGVEVGKEKLSIDKIIEICEKYNESLEFFNPIPRANKYLDNNDDYSS